MEKEKKLYQIFCSYIDACKKQNLILWDAIASPELLGPDKKQSHFINSFESTNEFKDLVKAFEEWFPKKLDEQNENLEYHNRSSLHYFFTYTGIYDRIISGKEFNKEKAFSIFLEELEKKQIEVLKYGEVFPLKIVTQRQDIANWYWDLINKNLKISSAMKDKVKEIIKDKERPEDKIDAIIKYMRNNFRYVSMSFGYHRYEPHPSDEVFTNKYGDCKDQVLVCMALLKEAGIKAYPVLFCSEDLGNPKEELPMPTEFEHVILRIELEDKAYYTDVLAKGYRFNEIPLELQGGYVFVVNDKGGAFGQLPILEETENLTYEESGVTIREDGSALVETTSLWPKELSISLRETWKNMTEKQKKEFLERLDEPHTADGKMLERNWENLDSDYGVIKSFIKYEKPSWAEVSGDFMSFGRGGYERNNDFLKEKRNYPIMFWLNSLDKKTNIYFIPENFEIVNCPKNIILKNEFIEFSRNYEIEERKITEKEIMRYKRVRIPTADYNKVKDFYNQLAQLTNEKIIIKKKR